MAKKKIKKSWFSKLTKAEQQIWKLIYYHPTFIRNRAFALDMLFCMIGTGLKWKDGEIVDTIEDNYLTAHKQGIYNLEKDIYKKAYTNALMGKGFTSGLKARDIRWMREFRYHDNCIAEYTLKNIEKAVTVAISPKYFYPLGTYSNLMEAPKNIKPDWLELALETCDLIIATDSLYRGSDNRLRNKNNIRLAKKQRKKLQALTRKDS